MSVKLFLKDEQATLDFGAKLSRWIPKNFILFLQGELGAGKTTLVRGFLRGLNIKDPVKSPTYTLIEPYHIKNKNIYHMDLYRLEKPSQLNELGFRDYFDCGICLVEWPERGEGYLIEPDLLGYLSLEELGRNITLTAHNKRGQEVLDNLVGTGRDLSLH